MTEDQRDDLVVELSLYEPRRIRQYVHEYQALPDDEYARLTIYDFLKHKLDIEGYWRKSGLA